MPRCAAKPGDSHITIGTCVCSSRRDGVRHAVQVQAVLAERFAVVGDVDQRRVDVVGALRLQAAIRLASTWSV